MGDDVAQYFITELQKIKTDKNFIDTIKIFSRFLGYENVNYKYNSTYLDQYIDDFISLQKSIVIKNEVYIKIAKELRKQKDIQKCIFDNSCCFIYKDNDIESYNYFSIDSKRINSFQIEIEIYFEKENGTKCFCRCYKFNESKNNFVKLMINEINTDLTYYIQSIYSENVHICEK